MLTVLADNAILIIPGVCLLWALIAIFREQLSLSRRDRAAMAGHSSLDTPQTQREEFVTLRIPSRLVLQEESPQGSVSYWVSAPPAYQHAERTASAIRGG